MLTLCWLPFRPRALVVFENEDDLGKAEDPEDERSKVDGNVGDGIAWSVIGLAQS